MSQNFTKLLRTVSRKKRGVSPIVAEMLLIGLTMLAGTIAFSAVIVVMTTKEPIVVNVDSFSDFKLNGFSNSTKYNSFSFVLDNQGKRAIGLRAQDFQVINTSTNNEIPNWQISRDYELGSLQSYYITANTTSTDQNTWLSFQSEIKIQLITYGLDASSYDSADKSTFTATTSITSNLISKGPLELNNTKGVVGYDNYANLTTSTPGSNSLNISVFNYGNLPVNYALDFIVSNSSINMTLTYFGNLTTLPSEIYGSLPAASGSQPAVSTVIELTATTPASLTNNYFIVVWLKLDSSIQDTLIINCN